MGGDDKSPVWNLRITYTEKNNRQAISRFCEANPAVKLACEEQAESLHSHIVIVCEKETCRSTVLAHVKKHIDLSGNKTYCLTKQKSGEDINGIYRYICKGTSPDYTIGGPDIIYNKDFMINVKEYHKDYWSKQDEFRATVKQLAEKKARENAKKKATIIIELTEKYKNSTLKDPYLTDTIAEEVLTAYQGNVKEDTLYTAVQAITFQISPETTKLNAIERVRRRLFPAYR